MEIPLFPLGTVLFPGGALALKIFETRYLDMVSRCLRDASAFGVVAIREGSEVGAAETFEVGTLAEIVDWDRLADGLLGITVAGRGSFRLEAREQKPDGLYVGRAVPLDPEPKVPLPEQYAPLARLLGELLPLAAHYRTVTIRYEDAGWVGARLVELLPLPIAAKQAMLELCDPVERLERLRTMLGTGAD